MADGAFLDELRNLYPWANIDAEEKKARAWLLTPKGRGRQFTRQFLVNWLNKLDVPMEKRPNSKLPSPTSEPALPDPDWWREFLTEHPEHEGQHFAQLSHADQERARDWGHQQAGKTLAQMRSTLRNAA